MDSINTFIMNADAGYVIDEVLRFSAPLSKVIEPYLGELYAPIPATMLTFYTPIFIMAYIMFGLMGEKGFLRCESMTF